jgi:hypothetical protein
MQPGSGRGLRSLGASTWPSPSSSIPFEHSLVELGPGSGPGRGPGRTPPGLEIPPPLAGAAPRPSRSRIAGAPAGKGLPHSRAAAAAPTARRSAAEMPAGWSGFESSAARLLHAAAGAPPPLASADPLDLPLHLHRHDPGGGDATPPHDGDRQPRRYGRSVGRRIGKVPSPGERQLRH